MAIAKRITRIIGAAAQAAWAALTQKEPTP